MLHSRIQQVIDSHVQTPQTRDEQRYLCMMWHVYIDTISVLSKFIFWPIKESKTLVLSRGPHHVSGNHCIFTKMPLILTDKEIA